VRRAIEHAWDLSPKQAIQLQQGLRSRVVTTDDFAAVQRVAGVDVGFEQGGTVTRAAVAVLELPGLSLVESQVARQPTRFPYIPGLLSFREVPAVLEAFERLSNRPDLLVCDGQGIAHPRRIGIASHLGLILDLPSLGVGKTRLVGRYAEPPQTKGAWTPLEDDRDTIGAVLRTRAGVKPVFISPGHRIGLESAVRYTLLCTPRFRLPEPVRQAHRLASQTR